MAFVLVTVGILMIVTGAKGTYAAFGSQVASDFTGSQPFTYWLAAIGGIGALGYVDALRTFSRLFMSLILVAMVLANKGFFAQFTAALKQGPVAPVGGTGSPSSSGSGILQPSSSGNGAFGQAPSSAGQAKFNGYANSAVQWLGSLFTGGNSQ
jgi:hypothetical protein